MNRKIWVTYGAEKLREAGIDNPDGEAWYLFSHSFSLSRVEYLFSMTTPVEEGEELEQYKALLDRRISERVPLQYRDRIRKVSSRRLWKGTIPMKASWMSVQAPDVLPSASV